MLPLCSQLLLLFWGLIDISVNPHLLEITGISDFFHKMSEPFTVGTEICYFALKYLGNYLLYNFNDGTAS